MEVGIAYDMTKYDFSEETWRYIFAYEQKLRSHKVFKKVNFKKGELETYIDWVKSIISTPEFFELISLGSENRDYTKRYFAERELKERQLTNVFYIKNKLERSLNKNKYVLEKVRRYGLKFSFYDVQEFLIVLKYADENDCLKEFLSIPDVWYIIRNIKSNWRTMTER